MGVKQSPFSRATRLYTRSFDHGSLGGRVPSLLPGRTTLQRRSKHLSAGIEAGDFAQSFFAEIIYACIYTCTYERENLYVRTYTYIHTYM